MKEFLVLALFTITPPIIMMITWWFISWELDWTTMLRGAMVIAGLVGFFAGLDFINKVIDGS